MSTYVWMKILESSPSRYDKAVKILTLGRVDNPYNSLTSLIKEGDKVLDIGWRRGTLTLRAAEKGAKVKGIGINPQMLEIAQKRGDEVKLTKNVKLCEMGVAELENERD